MIEITTDLYDIASRLQEINPKYRVFYRPQLAKYQLYIKEGEKVSYVLTFPFKKLDARAITHCYRTRIERTEEIMKEIACHNKELQRQETREAKKQAEQQAERILYQIGKK